jgi:hypothetical protein
MIPAAPQFTFELLMLLLAPFIDLYGACTRRRRPFVRGSVEELVTCTSKFPLTALLCCAMDGINATGTRMKKITVCKVRFSRT